MTPFATQTINADLMLAVSQIVTQHLATNPMPDDQVPGFIRVIADTLSDIATPRVSEIANSGMSCLRVPACPIDRSVTDEYIVCLEDGQKMRMLKRHLWSKYRMTPEEYRRRWGLPDDYPMVAPSYSRKRSEIATRTGFRAIG